MGMAAGVVWGMAGVGVGGEASASIVNFWGSSYTLDTRASAAFITTNDLDFNFVSGVAGPLTLMDTRSASVNLGPQEYATSSLSFSAAFVPDAMYV